MNVRPIKEGVEAFLAPRQFILLKTFPVNLGTQVNHMKFNS